MNFLIRFASKIPLCFLLLQPAPGLADTYGNADRKAIHSLNDPNGIRMEVKKTSAAVLQECRPAQGSRYLEAIKNVGKKDPACAQGDACTGMVKTEDRLGSTRELLYELRKIRESELYQIEALNALQYDPDFNINQPGIEARLNAYLCVRSKYALKRELLAALRERTLALPKGKTEESFVQSILTQKNDCVNSGSDSAKLINKGVANAIRQFKEKGLKKPAPSDLEGVNQALARIQNKCAPFQERNKNDDDSRLREDARRFGVRDESRFQLSGPAAAEVRGHAERKEEEQLRRYQQEVYPEIVKIFTSPYGRLLADSSHLQGMLGLPMQVDWATPAFCSPTLRAKRGLTEADIKTGYAGSTSKKITGLKNITHKHMGNLAMTRLPELRPHYWKSFDDSSFLQRPEARVQQQVALELLYHSSHPDVKSLIQNNPLYAELACSAVEHEAFWEKESIRDSVEFAKNIASYGGLAVGVVSGFFSMGGGWALTAALASGMAASTIDLHQGLQQSKADTLARIEDAQTALSIQHQTRQVLPSKSAAKEVESLNPNERAKYAKYEEQFKKAMAEQTINAGRTILNAQAPDELLQELIDSAKTARDKYLINLAYDAVSTAATFGVGKGLSALQKMAATNHLTSLEKVSRLAAKLETGAITPTDIADAFGTCLFLDDCSGAGVMMGAGIHASSTNLKKLFDSYRGRKENRGKSVEGLMEEIAGLISEESGGAAKKQDVLAELKKRLKAGDARGEENPNVASEQKDIAAPDAAAYREPYVRDQVAMNFGKASEIWLMDGYLKIATTEQKLGLQRAFEALEDAKRLTPAERGEWLKKIHDRVKKCGDLSR
ncbi:MAG: hypothetical protein KGP28_07760 [Bdellovibrionales bacterium]|nr:hypothetical protein [Bdellovibrionales bacterium]